MINLTRANKMEATAIVAILVVAAAVRLYRLQEESMWGDEWSSYNSN